MVTTTLMIMILVGFTGVVVGALMILRDRLVKERRTQAITQISNEVTEYYLPKVKEIEIAMMDEMLEKFCEKLPDTMVKTMNATKEMMEQEGESVLNNF